jgi:hypothetical protein
MATILNFSALFEHLRFSALLMPQLAPGFELRTVLASFIYVLPNLVSNMSSSTQLNQESKHTTILTPLTVVVAVVILELGYKDLDNVYSRYIEPLRSPLEVRI